MTTISASSCFTCASCQVIFNNSEEQRSHYQSDWHRYNLKRKVAELPPVLESVYLQRLSNLQSTTQKREDDVKEAYIPRECTVCRKIFASEKTLETHLKSKKHIELVTKSDLVDLEKVVKILEKTSLDGKKSLSLLAINETMSEAQVDAALQAHLEKIKPLLLEECLFCSHKNKDFEANMEHMTLEHSLYIPDLPYVVDLEKLIQYLGEKIAIGFTCIYCPSTIQPFQSLHSVRKHMQDKGHCKIRFDESGCTELSEFYDYTSSYPIAEDDGNEEYEDVDSGEDMEMCYENGPAVSIDGTELVLADGRAVGHRAYRHFYKQNLQAYMSDRAPRSKQREVADKLIHHYKEAGLIPHLPTKKSRYDEKAYYDNRKAWELRIGMKNNRQEYYRLDWLQ